MENMDLFGGLEKFGLKIDDDKREIFTEEKKNTPVKAEKKEETAEKEAEKPEVKAPPETEFLFKKHIRCTVCEKVFEVKMVKSARVRRMLPDFDLRPRYENIDTLKYDVYACPYCGYAAQSRYFDHLTKGQINLVKETICANFAPTMIDNSPTYDYETAIARYQLALYNSMVKRGKNSEKAYTCLKLSWLYRSMADEMPETIDEEKAKKAECREYQEKYYREAFDGFQKALASEDFPMCGMDSYTMDYMLAAIACHFKEYSFASKAVSNILTSQMADRRIKDRALELKEQIIEQIRKNAGQ